MPRPSTRADAGTCSTRCTGPSGGKSELASSGVISTTSPGERRSTTSAKGANQSSSLVAQADGEDAAAAVARPSMAAPSAASRASSAG